MSKIGRQPILLPKGVEVKLSKDGRVEMHGPLGHLEKVFDIDKIKIEQKEGKLLLVPRYHSQTTKTLWGTYRSILKNMVEGVSKGFKKELRIEGLGYRAGVEGEALRLEIGFSHPVFLKIPKGLEVKTGKGSIEVFGVDKELVGQFAAEVRAKRPPEPYKGKGIAYADEKIHRKSGKKTIEAA